MGCFFFFAKLPLMSFSSKTTKYKTDDTDSVIWYLLPKCLTYLNVEMKVTASDFHFMYAWYFNKRYNIKIISKTLPLTFCVIVIVRKGPIMFLAFMVTLTKEFTSPRTYIQAFFKIFIYKMELATNEITSPLTRKTLTTHEHWLPRIKWFHSICLT